MKNQKIKTSTIFFGIAFVFLLILIGPYILPLAIVGVEVGQEGVKLTIEDLSERNAILLFLTIVSTFIGIWLKSKDK